MGAGILLEWGAAVGGGFAHQMGFSISFLEEIWSRNLGHIFVSPLRPRELVAGLMVMSVLRAAIGVVPAMILAWVLYSSNILSLGPALVGFFAALIIMGWAVALGVTSLILRYGAGAEALAWSVLVRHHALRRGVLPRQCFARLLQPFALALPAAHVFEGMRAALLEGRFAAGHMAAAFALDGVWLAGMSWVFMRQFQGARVRGALLNIGE